MDQPDASPKILVSPLDWGLGHATRCIPIIHELLRQNCRVILAASGREKNLLQQEFPLLHILPLPGYGIKYAATSWGLIIKIVAQIPKLLSAIKKEQAWLQKVVEDNGIDAIISDNRYGLYHPITPCVFMTHQLRIKAPFNVVENLLQKFNYRYIHRFYQCWIPDTEGTENLAGELSHPMYRPVLPLHYIGPLSRFEKNDSHTEGNYLLIVLSGPEPQRTMLEKILLSDLKEYTEPVVLVRGLPDAATTLKLGSQVKVYNHLPAAHLQVLFAGAFLVIGRCGYSTIMDLAAMQKKSILVPTPGQTEQEYLAKHLMQKKLALCVAQKKFTLKKALALAATFPYLPYQATSNRLEVTIKNFLAAVKSSKGNPAAQSA